MYWQVVSKNKLNDSFWSKKKLEAKCDYDGLCKYFCEPKKKDAKSNMDEKSIKIEVKQIVKSSA